MNTETLEGKFKQIKGEFKKKYGKLTDNEIKETEGKFDKLAGIVEEKYGKTRDELEQEIRSW